MEKTLTIGMAHYSDYHGVFFTIQDIIKELAFNQRRDLLSQIEFLIVENNSSCPHAKAVKNFAAKHRGMVRVVDLDEKQGTSCTRNKIIEEATTNFVMVMDCHILLCPVVDTLDKLLQFINYNSKSEDLYSGPLVFDNMREIYTHFNDEWGGGMWGRWGTAWRCVCEAFNFSVVPEGKKCKFVSLDTQQELKKCGYCERNFPSDMNHAGHEGKLSSEGFDRIGFDPKEKPFEIFAQGLGLFLTRKNSWLKFNEDQSGFGGEECYIHEKYRRAGRKCVCLPFLKWIHRFGRPEGVQYGVSTEQKLKNYIYEFKELGLDPTPLRRHFIGELNVSEQFFNDTWGSEPEKPIEKDLESEIVALQNKLKELQGKKCCKNK